jgi:hypothetical protein
MLHAGLLCRAQKCKGSECRQVTPRMNLIRFDTIQLYTMYIKNMFDRDARYGYGNHARGMPHVYTDGISAIMAKS